MGTPTPKQYLSIRGKPILRWTLERLAGHPAIDGIVLVVSPDDEDWRPLTSPLPCPLYTAAGGRERAHSVLNGLGRLKSLTHSDAWVLVHDAARPCVRHSDIDRLLTELSDHPVGGLLAVPISDTVKRTNADGDVLQTVSREHLWRAQTPQMFRLGPLIDALSQALSSNREITDDASAMEMQGLQPRIVEGHPDNIKVTQLADLDLADLFLQRQLDPHGTRVLG